MVVSGYLHAPAALDTEQTPGSSWDPTAGLDTVNKIFPFASSRGQIPTTQSSLP
jgi:hypothetical protein